MINSTPAELPILVGVLIVSGSESLLDDVGHSAWQRVGGDLMAAALPPDQFTLLRLLVLPGGSAAEIAMILKDWCDAPNPAYRCQLILTVGGDGLATAETVPEATRQVIQRDAPGLAERLRQMCGQYSTDPEAAQARAALSRATAGMRRGCLIVNLPGCYDDPGRAIEALLTLLPDALAAIQ